MEPYTVDVVIFNNRMCDCPWKNSDSKEKILEDKPYDYKVKSVTIYFNELMSIEQVASIIKQQMEEDCADLVMFALDGQVYREAQPIDDRMVG